MINQIINADCFDILPDIEDNSIDAIITDPPYNVTALAWDVKIDLDKMWGEFLRVGKPDCQYIIFSKQPFTTDLINSNRVNFKYELIWIKSRAVGFLAAKARPLMKHENITLYGKGENKYNAILKKGVPYIKRSHNKKGPKIYGDKTLKDSINNGFRYPVSILEHANSTPGNIHPTEKPLSLIKDLIRMYTNQGDLILDLFSGSGVLAVASYETKRNFICIEKEVGYYEKSVKRYNQAYKQIMFDSM